MARLSFDSEQRKIASRAFAIVHYLLDAGHWAYREEKDLDIGRDCVIELSENDRWLNHKIEAQIKGTKHPLLLKNGEAFSIPVDKKTINYALRSSSAFLIFYVDVTEEIVYYFSVQDFFINNKEFFSKLDAEQETINLHLPVENILTEDDSLLQEIARSTYADGPGDELKKYVQMQFEQGSLFDL